MADLQKYIARIPNDYQETEYVSSNGGCYIDTGIIPSAAKLTKVSYSMQMNDITSGEYQSIGCNMNMNFYANSNVLKFRSNGVEMSNLDTNWHTVSIEKLQDGKKTVFDGVIYTTSATSNEPFSFTLFAMRNNLTTSLSYFGKYKLKEFKMWDNGELVADFIPCYRKSDNVVGMYDVITNAFFAPIGGSLSAGNDVVAWKHSLRKMSTATETIQSGDTIYANGQPISTYTIKGNTVQNGTPTPSNPVPVVGVGELETTGEHLGEYKIPILTAQGSAVNYLGNINSRRLVKKVVLTGTETEDTLKMQSTNIFYVKINSTVSLDMANCICTHYVNNQVVNVQMNNGEIKQDRTSTWGETSGVIVIKDTSISTLEGFKSYLAAQYAAGTPVTIWYVISLPETGQINEPLMAIGAFYDSISNAAAIPTVDGANTISVDTTVQPSEFTATWTGWHDATVKEWGGSDWQ